MTREMEKVKNEADLARTKELINSLPEEKSVKLQRIFENKCSAWLSIIPTNKLFLLCPQMNLEMLLHSGLSLFRKDSQANAMVAVKFLIFVMH